MTRICIVVVAISAALPFVAGARGGHAGRGGANGNTPKDGCSGPLAGRSGLVTGRTTKDSHQPFAEYDGQIVTPPSQKYQAKLSWFLVIDRCKKTPKVALVVGDIPGYYCGSAEVFARDASADLYTFRKEAAISSGQFNASIAARVYNYTINGSLGGSVHIPKRGHGTGSGTIAGTVTPTECPSVSFSYSVKFKRTWSFILRGGTT